MKKIMIIAALAFSYSLLGFTNNAKPNDYTVESQAKEYPYYVWRYVDHVGWRKFTPLGASIRDWGQIKRVNRHRWPWWY